jgi:acyl carrier protein
LSLIAGAFKVALEDELKRMMVKDLNLVGVDPDCWDDDDALFGAGVGLDSLDAVELVVLLQKNYGVKIDDLDVGREAFASIKTLADYIREQKGASVSRAVPPSTVAGP